jgi:hypothetical protein
MSFSALQLGDNFAPLRFGITPQFLDELAKLSLQKLYAIHGSPEARTKLMLAQAGHYDALSSAIPADIEYKQALSQQALAQASRIREEILSDHEIRSLFSDYLPFILSNIHNTIGISAPSSDLIGRISNTPSILEKTISDRLRAIPIQGQSEKKRYNYSILDALGIPGLF